MYYLFSGAIRDDQRNIVHEAILGKSLVVSIFMREKNITN